MQLALESQPSQLLSKDGEESKSWTSYGEQIIVFVETDSDALMLQPPENMSTVMQGYNLILIAIKNDMKSHPR